MKQKSRGEDSTGECFYRARIKRRTERRGRNISEKRGRWRSHRYPPDGKAETLDTSIIVREIGPKESALGGKTCWDIPVREGRHYPGVAITTSDKSRKGPKGGTFEGVTV